MDSALSVARMTLELTGRRYSSEKESSLKPWTSCSLFLCVEDLAAVFPEECLKHLTAKWFFSPYLIQLSPQAGQSSCLFVCHFPQNLHAMTVLNPLSLGFMFSEVLPFDFPSEKNLPSSLLLIACNLKVVALFDLQISIHLVRVSSCSWRRSLRVPLSRNSNNISVTNNTIQQQTIVAHFRQSVKCSYIRINGLAQLLVLLGYLIELVNFISFAYNKASNFPSTASISWRSFSLSKLSPSTICSASGPEHASNVDVLSSFDCLT